jgi:hypothetical protein
VVCYSSRPNPLPGRAKRNVQPRILPRTRRFRTVPSNVEPVPESETRGSWQAGVPAPSCRSPTFGLGYGRLPPEDAPPSTTPPGLVWKCRVARWEGSWPLRGADLSLRATAADRNAASSRTNGEARSYSRWLNDSRCLQRPTRRSADFATPHHAVRHTLREPLLPNATYNPLIVGPRSSQSRKLTGPCPECHRESVRGTCARATR